MTKDHSHQRENQFNDVLDDKAATEINPKLPSPFTYILWVVKPSDHDETFLSDIPGGFARNCLRFMLPPTHNFAPFKPYTLYFVFSERTGAFYGPYALHNHDEEVAKRRKFLHDQSVAVAMKQRFAFPVGTIKMIDASDRLKPKHMQSNWAAPRNFQCPLAHGALTVQHGQKLLNKFEINPVKLKKSYEHLARHLKWDITKEFFPPSLAMYVDLPPEDTDN